MAQTDLYEKYDSFSYKRNHAPPYFTENPRFALTGDLYAFSGTRTTAGDGPLILRNTDRLRSIAITQTGRPAENTIDLHRL